MFRYPFQRMGLKSFFLTMAIVLALPVFIACNSGKNRLPDNFKRLSTEDKMEYLMANMTPDSVANFICEAAMGRIYDVRIELQPARAYAFEHYDEDDLVAFEQQCNLFEQSLPLHEKVRFAKLAATEDFDSYSYELGLNYVGVIREQKKDVATISEELANLRKECRYDPDFYKRFMKGFKTALRLDRHHDLDDKIYTQFISYPDSIK